MNTYEAIYKGLEHVVGNLRACELRVWFDQAYDKKHGDYLNVAQIATQTDNANIYRAYCDRRTEVWRRVAMREVHRYEQRLYGKQQELTFPHKFP